MTWLILLIVVVALVTVVFSSFRGPSASSVSAKPPSFTPNPENDKVVLIKGWDETEIKKIIRDFVEAYEDDGYPGYTIEHHKQFENFYRLVFPQDIHPWLFMFLVNYVAYPFDLDLEKRSIVVGGKTTLSADFEIDPALVGKKSIFYIPEKDEERTVVYLQTESGVTLANSFSEMGWKRVDDPRLANEVKNLV
jgi:hypothetical protein